MKLRILFSLICATLLAVGCSSQPARVSSPEGSGSSGPEMLLPGGQVEEAQLLAMGMARSKGWTIAETGDRHFLLERELPSDSPQAQLLSPEGVLSRPKLQVETQLRDRGNDVIVSLSAYVVANPGTEQERRIDYSRDYENQLTISLNALASAWLENRTRIASEIPLPPDPDQVVIAEASTAGDTHEPASAEVDPTTTAAATTTLPMPAAPPTPLPIEPLPTAPPAAPPTPSQMAAAEPREAQGVDVADADVADSPSELNEMLVLDGQSRRGLWTFYAEASARERGCTLGDRGAVLLNTSTAFELYEVQCISSANLLLRCAGGICRELN
ncbi:MAG: hypothetical protein VBE63_12280 [Lamprobacter sp.]|uniref:hypothetical protein n=1 Tax=Lamprobacter sp. TaxID=3100796 RepID=UPI002B263FE7|nr:hypothetical protein [Lamprobacter sp.]MEA3640705.1 hypothetical protein [Lamprobacter sp.]